MNLPSLSKYLSERSANLFFRWLLLSGPCPHQSVPVEMDESMTSSSLDLAWPPSCKQCRGHTETSGQRPLACGGEQDGGTAHDVGQWRTPESRYQLEPGAACHAAPRPRFIPPAYSEHMNPLHPAGVWPPHGLREQAPLYQRDLEVVHGRGLASPSNYPQEGSLEESLEPAFQLMSDFNCSHFVPPRYPAPRVPGQCHCRIISYH